MESEFASVIGRWQSFQSLAGSVAATLLGLIFVAVSIRPALFREEDHPDFLSIGAKSMGLFMLVVIIALLFQVPDPRPIDIGTALAICALISLFNTARQIIIMRRILDEWGILFLSRRILLPAVGYVLLLAVSITIYMGETRWINVVALTQLLFLFTGTYNAWALLMRIGKS